MNVQPNLLDWKPPASDRCGSTYDRAFDFNRLNRQARAVYEAMKDGKARTLREIADLTGEPEASISARLREYNNPAFSRAGVSMEKQRRASGGTWEYWLVIQA